MRGIFGVSLDAVSWRAVKVFALTALLLAPAIAPTSARAQDGACDSSEDDCPCERGWGCWDLLYSTPGTLLGVEGTLTRISSEADELLDAGFLAKYATEHYGTRKRLTGHFQAFGSIGAGTAGNEGSLGGAVDFGYRLDATKVSGPFGRIGATGLLLGNDALALSMFEPLQGRVGYQFLDDDTLIESGLTAGVVAAGRYRAGESGARGIAPSAELGAYAALHVSAYRFDAGVSQLQASAFGPGTPVDLVRLGMCGYLQPLALCANVLFVRGDVPVGRRAYMRAGSLSMGLTLGLTP